MTTQKETPAALAGAHRGQGTSLDGEHPKYSTDAPDAPQLDDLARRARAAWLSAARRMGASRTPEGRHEVRAMRLWAREIALAAAAEAAGGGR